MNPITHAPGEAAELMAWRNRALLAEAQLATLRAEYEPHHPTEPPC